MSSFPRSPRLIKGGIVLLDQQTGIVQRIITLQYNPDTLTRTLQPRTMTGESTNPVEALRLTGPPVETYKLDAELDATDQLETAADANALAVKTGIQPILSALETIIYPRSAQLLANNALAQTGTIEIAPMETSLILFVWNKNRIVPVRFTDFSITEEAFDINLNPIRAKISLGMRVLSVDDFGFDHRGGSLYLNYHQNKESLAGQFASGSLSSLGINAIS